MKSLDKNHYLILEIVSKYNNGDPIGSQTLDRVFYDKRLKSGCSLNELYDVKWLPKISELVELGLIEKHGQSNKITHEGLDVLKSHIANRVINHTRQTLIKSSLVAKIVSYPQKITGQLRLNMCHFTLRELNKRSKLIICIFLTVIPSIVGYSQDSGIRKIELLNEFLYDQLLSKNIGPFAAINEKGVAYLDTSSYFDRLKTFEIFNKDFFFNESNRVRQCAQDIAVLDYRENNFDLGWEPKSCSFFNYAYWLKSQETPQGFETSNVVIKDSSASSKIRFFNKYKGKKWYWSDSLEIRYLLDGMDHWKVQSIVFSQSFKRYLNNIYLLKHPKKFNEGSQVDFPKQILPPDLFSDPIFHLDKDRAYAKLMLDENYPIILIGRLADTGDYFISAGAASFDSNGSFIDFLSLFHSADGEGSTYSISSENKIRVANYGAMEAVINAYNYENGHFIKVGEPEYGDVDNLPDY